MELIPVLDLLDGHVVRGVAGRRESYAPIESTLVDSAEPLNIARAIRHTFGLHRLYVADLDAIMHDAPHWSTIEALVADGFDLMIDAGLREPTRASQLVERGVKQVVAALETLPGCDPLADIIQCVGGERVVFSLDLMHGCALGDLSAWGVDNPLTIVNRAVATGVKSVIVLDLSGVGVSQGVPTLDLCRQLTKRQSSVRVITGGGVRHAADVRLARESGIGGLLVASALHDGSMTPHEIAALTSERPAGLSSSGQPDSSRKTV